MISSALHRSQKADKLCDAIPGGVLLSAQGEATRSANWITKACKAFKDLAKTFNETLGQLVRTAQQLDFKAMLAWQAPLGANLDFLVGGSGAAVPRDSH